IFLVKVQNESGTTAALNAVSPNAVSVFDLDAGRGRFRGTTPSDAIYRDSDGRRSSPNPADLWLAVELFTKPPLKKELSGLGLEYAIVQLYSRDTGKREAKLAFNVGQGTQDIGFRNELDILFDCERSSDVAFRVLDENGQPATASFVIRDKRSV